MLFIFLHFLFMYFVFCFLIHAYSVVRFKYLQSHLRDLSNCVQKPEKGFCTQLLKLHS